MSSSIFRLLILTQRILSCSKSSCKIILDRVDTSTLKESELARMRGRKIGFIFQFFNLHPTLIALENIELPMIIIEENKNDRRKKALDLFKSVGLENRFLLTKIFLFSF